MQNPLIPAGGHIFQVLGFLVWGAFMLVAAAIAIGVVILLVRFLWFGTKAAKLYLANHEPAVAGTETPVSPTVPEPAPTVTPDASGPVPKSRKPKA